MGQRHILTCGWEFLDRFHQQGVGVNIRLGIWKVLQPATHHVFLAEDRAVGVLLKAVILVAFILWEEVRMT